MEGKELGGVGVTKEEQKGESKESVRVTAMEGREAGGEGGEGREGRKYEGCGSSSGVGDEGFREGTETGDEEEEEEEGGRNRRWRKIKKK